MPVKSSRWAAATAKSASVEWGTPQDLFDALHQEFSFTVDAAASDLNAKLARYWTLADDGLLQDWSGERVFVNPPFGKDIARWVSKANRETQRECPLVVMLIPARTDTRWWHKDVEGIATPRFLKGRLRYTDGGQPRQPAPFPSVVLVYRRTA